jgi:hypothetical protein
MSKFLILYRAPRSVVEERKAATPEQRWSGLAGWQAWATRVGYALSDLGAPVTHTTHVGEGTASADDVCGYSLLEAGSADEVRTLLDGNPHLTMPGASIEVLEAIPMA